MAVCVLITYVCIYVCRCVWNADNKTITLSFWSSPPCLCAERGRANLTYPPPVVPEYEQLYHNTILRRVLSWANVDTALPEAVVLGVPLALVGAGVTKTRHAPMQQYLEHTGLDHPTLTSGDALDQRRVLDCTVGRRSDGKAST